MSMSIKKLMKRHGIRNSSIGKFQVASNISLYQKAPKKNKKILAELTKIQQYLNNNL